MGKYILKRIFYAALTVFALLTITFFLMQLLPGDPFIGDKAISPVILEALYKKYGLDKPVWEQFLIYVGNFLRGDLGTSLKYNRPIMTMIAESFPISAELGLRSLVIAVVFGLSLGSIAAIKRGKWQDTSSMIVAILGVSIPSFIIGALLQFFLSVQFRKWFGITYFPVTGWKTEAHKILPAIALSLSSMATVARLMRTSMLDVLGQDYIKTAKAKGLSQRAIIWRHGVRNAILPVVTVLGPIVAAVLTGSFVVENIFSIPGMGKFFVRAIQEYDYPMIAGSTVFYGAFLVLMTLLVDILYGFIDPRIKIGGGGAKRRKEKAPKSALKEA
ncbi:MAG TPA: ABC transporter permease [Pseudoflavonifractor sp.]|nr:ABC transporter permease [Pseudoflavonifractor sp.]